MEWWTLPIAVAATGGLLAGLWAFINRRGTQRFQSRNPLPPTWPEMWQRMNDQDTKIEQLEKRLATRDRAFTNILLSAARQWPADTPGPLFEKADLDVLEDTMPPAWVKRSRTA